MEQTWEGQWSTSRTHISPRSAPSRGGTQQQLSMLLAETPCPGAGSWLPVTGPLTNPSVSEALGHLKGKPGVGSFQRGLTWAFSGSEEGMVVVHVCRFLERPRPQLPGSSCPHSLASSLLPFLPVVQSLETISALAANARDQLGSQESGASKGKGGFPWAQTEQPGLVGRQPLLLRVVSSHISSL